ncbi:8741_t:CDS:2 [Cetraspora pellucida]|uniref:8741_t:CDS:1 n=1 Tax=Cetraspora pellucida TaxID=1433469 RepID=A0ACA9KN47_9GLOM|nr:8741_t:CDS:2 [Cetraspora pellucida]
MKQILKKRKLVNFKVSDFVKLKALETAISEFNEDSLGQISIREVVRLQSIEMMSGSICNCKSLYDNKKCKYKKINAKCTSHCYSSRFCLNKE